MQQHPHCLMELPPLSPEKKKYRMTYLFLVMTRDGQQ